MINGPLSLFNHYYTEKDSLPARLHVLILLCLSICLHRFNFKVAVEVMSVNYDNDLLLRGVQELNRLYN